MEEEKYKLNTSDDEVPLEDFVADIEGIMSQHLNAKQTKDFTSFFLVKMRGH